MKKTYFLLMMGGSGTRFGANVPKQFLKVQEKDIYLYILDELIKSSLVDGICIVCNSEWIEYVKSNRSNSKILEVISGGNTRSESVFNGLKFLENIANDDDNVLIHDATHPYIDLKNIGNLIKKIEEVGAATYITRIYDTCYLRNKESNIAGTIDRNNVCVGASPEGFTFGTIKKVYFDSTKEELDSMTSAGALLLNKGIRMALVETPLLNLKITYPVDLELFKILCNTYYYSEE